MAHGATSMKTERRRAPRRLCNEMALIITATGERHNCMMRDVSRFGALVLVAAIDDLPTEFTLESRSMKRAARAVWWGRCRVGVVFD
jgi:hypothetical protein